MIRILALLVLATGAVHAAALPATVDLRVEKKPLFALLQRIARQCDAGLVVDHRLAPVVDKEVTLAISDAPWAEAVRLLATDYRIALTLAGGHLVVADADEEARRELVTRSYGLVTLTREVGEYPGPSLAIPEPGAVGVRLMPGITAQPVAVRATGLVEDIRRSVAVDTWDQLGVAVSADAVRLEVTQRPEVQAQIAAFLARLERNAARQVVLRCYRLPAGTAAAAPVLDAAAWQKLAPTAGAPVGAFVAVDEQRNHHFSGVQRAIVADVDVNQGVFDPIMTRVTTGLVVDARPQVVKQGVLLSVRLTVGSDEKSGAAVIADGRGTPAATVDLPASTLDASHDTRLVPAGGAALYGSGERVYALTAEVLDYARGP